MAVSKVFLWQFALKSVCPGLFSKWLSIIHVVLFLAISLTPLLRGQEKSTENSARENKHRVEGFVTLPNGLPADKATIYLRVANGGTIRLPVNPHVTNSDASGRYIINDLAPGTYQIWAEQAELTTLTEKLRGKEVIIEKGVEAAGNVSLKLHHGCGYSIKVIDQATDTGVPGALIRFSGSDIKREYRTNQEGIAEIGGLASSDWHFMIEAESYAIQQLKTPKQKLGSVTKLTFKMVSGTSLLGRIRDDKGDAIPNVKISASDANGTVRYGEVTSKENGEYVIPSLPRGGSIRLFVEAEGFERTMKVVTTSAENPSVSLDIALIRRPYGGDCVIEVTDEQGAPIAGANVENMGNSSSDIRRAVTDEKGRCRLNDLHTGIRGTNASVSASRYISQSVTLEVGTPEEPGRVNVKLVQGASILGRLIDPDGKPASKVRVYFNQGERAFAGGGQTETDDEGYFRFNELPNPCTFTFYTPAPFAPIRDFRLPVGTDDEIVVVMEMEGVLRVQAIDKQTREPIPAFNVKLGFTPDRQREDPRMSILSQLLEPGTDILGDVKVFRLGRLQQGTPFQVTVSAIGYEKTVVRRAVATFEAESQILDVTLTRESENEWRTVSGYLRDSDGMPAEGATMHLIVSEEDPNASGWHANWSLIKSGQISRQAECHQFLTTTSNKDGSFKFERAKVAPWMQLVHMGGGIANGRHTVVEPMKANTLEDLALVANRGGTLRVTVDRKRFPSAQMVRVSLPRPNDNSDTFDYDSEKIGSDTTEVVFKALPPGEYTVVLERDRRELINLPIPGAFTNEVFDQRKIIVEEDSNVNVAF